MVTWSGPLCAFSHLEWSENRSMPRHATPWGSEGGVPGEALRIPFGKIREP